MNFLMLRSSQTAASEQPSVQESHNEASYVSKPAATLEGLITEEPFPLRSSIDDGDGVEEKNGSFEESSGKNNNSRTSEKHIDVTEDQGWITIPYKELPDDWSDAPDILSFRSLDRSFVFPGEQVHILACLSACKQDTEIITPFKVAALMSKNGIAKSPEKQNGNVGYGTNSPSKEAEMVRDAMDQEDKSVPNQKIDARKDVYSSETILRMEDHKRQTEKLLERFRNSHFFVRIAESDEPLWSKRSTSKVSSDDMVADTRKPAEKKPSLSAAVDRGNFDASASGGVARNAIKCCSLPTGDIVVLLQVSVGVDFVRDPVLEILQFEKHQEKILTSENQGNASYANQDPCGELLKWLLPLDNSIPPPVRSLSPPPMSSSSGIRTVSTKSNFSSSSSSQLFSFGNFRSYSMSSLPQNVSQPPPPPPVTTSNSRPSMDLEDWNRFSSQKLGSSEKSGSEELLSFRGVSLEPERFSISCGLEGIYIPGRKWRRKIELIHPIEIHSFAADCNTEDLLCVQIQNISPAHTPDIIVYIDAITIISEEASKVAPSSLPIVCIEAGNEHSLPNLALRRGEEHSFILKPSTSSWMNSKVHAPIQAGNAASSLHRLSSTDQYAVLVSCRCNYTESSLFFKQTTSWRPRISRDLMISVASEMSSQTRGSNGRVPQLPVQVLTLQASNLTHEDLTMTVLAPDSFTSPPSVLSLSSSPSSPMSPFDGSSDFPVSATQKPGPAPSVVENELQIGDGIPISDVLPNSDLGCTHLWLHSRVPLGCVPAQSTATIKLELLPLTDGIITLDSLQINVKEKGVTYIPEHSLKITSTSSIATGII